MGVWTARIDLLAVAPRLESWKELQAWIAETELLEPDVAQGQAQLASDPADVQANLKLARENRTELDKEALMERTLLPEDGVASPGAPAAPTPAPAAPTPAPDAAAQPPAGQSAAVQPAAGQPVAGQPVAVQSPASSSTK